MKRFTAVLGFLFFSSVPVLVPVFVLAQVQPVAVVVSSDPIPVSSCPILIRSLSLGSRGNDVSQLQAFLKSQNLLNTDISGYFGPLTAQAVASFQAKNGLDSVGQIGPRTIALLLAKCRKPYVPSIQPPVTPTTTPSITVISPNGGEVWDIDKQYEIHWTTNVSGTTYVYLQFADGSMCNMGTVGINGPQPAGPGIFYLIPSSTGCSGNITKHVTPGQYKVALFINKPGETSDIGTAHDTSDNYFTIASSTSTLVPQVVSFTVTPTTFNPNSYPNAYNVSYSLSNTTSNSGVTVGVACHPGLTVQKMNDGGKLVPFSCGDIGVGGANGYFAYSTQDLPLAFTNMTSQTISEQITLSAYGMNSVSQTVMIPPARTPFAPPPRGPFLPTTTPATVITQIDPTSPATKRIVITSTSQVTSNVTLGVFDLKSQNQSSTVNGLSFNFHTSDSQDVAHIYTNLRIQVGGQTYGSNQIGSTTAFTNMTVSLPQDVWMPVTLIADVQTDVVNVSASSTLIASGITGVDANHNTLVTSLASNQTSADIAYSLSGVSVSNLTATLGTCTGATNTSSNNKCPVTMSFTLTNIGNSDVYISKNPAIALGTSSVPATSSTSLQSIFIPGGVGDTVAAYDVPSGSSRTFVYNGTFSQVAGGGFESFKVTAINYGPTGSNTNTSSINSGLEILFVSQTLTSPNPVSTPTSLSPADINGDGSVNSTDNTLFLSCLGLASPFSNPVCTKADFDHDGDVDGLDSLKFKTEYVKWGIATSTSQSAAVLDALNTILNYLQTVITH